VVTPARDPRNRHCYISAVQQERFGPIDFDRFHEEELPALLHQRGTVFSEADALLVRPLGIRLSDGRGYTYVPEGSTFSVRPGTAAATTVVELPRRLVRFHMGAQDLLRPPLRRPADRLSGPFRPDGALGAAAPCRLQ